MSKTTELIKYNMRKSENAFSKTEKAIYFMTRNGIPINICRLSKHAGVSRSFLYNNKKIRSLIGKYRDEHGSNNSIQVVDESDNITLYESKIVQIKSELVNVQNLNKQLKNEFEKKVKEHEKLKSKYENMKFKLEELRRQLENAY